MSVKPKRVRPRSTKSAKSSPTFKNRGGSRFSLSIDDDALHDILVQECPGLGGSFKMTGVTKPQHVADTYRAVLFFMWGIPLDTPINAETLDTFNRAVKRLKKEDPALFKED